jgi:hypothetical protein
MVNQELFDVAVQLHPVGAVTLTVLDPEDAERFPVVGETLNEQAAPCCVTVTVSPATVNVPVRGDVDVLVAML